MNSPRLGFHHDSGWSHLGSARQARQAPRSVDFGQISDAAVDEMFGFEELEEVYLNAEIDDLLSDDDDSSFGLDEDDFDEDEEFGASLQPYVEPQVRRARREPSSPPKYGSGCASCSAPSFERLNHRHGPSRDTFGQDSFGQDSYGFVVSLPVMPEPPSRTDTFVDSAVVGTGLGLGFFGALWLVSSLTRAS